MVARFVDLLSVDMHAFQRRRESRASQGDLNVYCGQANGQVGSSKGDKAAHLDLNENT